MSSETQPYLGITEVLEFIIPVLLSRNMASSDSSEDSLNQTRKTQIINPQSPMGKPKQDCEQAGRPERADSDSDSDSDNKIMTFSNDAKDTIRAAFICGVCGDIPEEVKIYTCDKAHYTCVRCTWRLDLPKCPTCQGPFETKHNILLTRFYPLLMKEVVFTCPDCDIENMNLEVYMRHKLYCKRQVLPCPSYRFYGIHFPSPNCKGIRDIQEFLNHVKGHATTTCHYSDKPYVETLKFSEGTEDYEVWPFHFKIQAHAEIVGPRMMVVKINGAVKYIAIVIIRSNRDHYDYELAKTDFSKFNFIYISAFMLYSTLEESINCWYEIEVSPYDQKLENKKSTLQKNRHGSKIVTGIPAPWQDYNQTMAKRKMTSRSLGENRNIGLKYSDVLVSDVDELEISARTLSVVTNDTNSRGDTKDGVLNITFRLYISMPEATEHQD